jgi:sugar lactone lactonase YvrE
MSYTRIVLVCSTVSFLIWAACLPSEGRSGRAVQADPVDQSMVAPAGQLEIVARIEDPGPSGVAVSKTGRLFLGFPRHALDHRGPTLAEYRDGHLIPFPDAAMSLPSDAPNQRRLVSVHGMVFDDRDRLWVIDDGKEAGKPLQPGAAKVVGFAISSGTVIASVVLHPPVLLPDSHMNDLRVDLTHGTGGTAYVTDSSFGMSPALVVVDLASGKARRVLAGHASTAADPKFLAFLEGRPLVYAAKDAPLPTGGADGIAISPNGKRLYWTALSGRRLYSIATDVLSDFNATDETLGGSVKDEGERPACDGLATDPDGRIYFGAFEQDSLVRRELNGTYTLLVRDPRIIWPDGLCWAGSYLYATLGQWNRLPTMNGGRNLRQPPFLVARVRTQDRHR